MRIKWVVQEDYDNLGWETQSIIGPFTSEEKAQAWADEAQRKHQGRSEDRWSYSVYALNNP